jgi:hypothetical protein
MGLSRRDSSQKILTNLGTKSALRAYKAKSRGNHWEGSQGPGNQAMANNVGNAASANAKSAFFSPFRPPA